MRSVCRFCVKNGRKSADYAVLHKSFPWYHVTRKEVLRQKGDDTNENAGKYFIIVGIPIGKQCFKLCSISLNPFGKEVEYGGGAVSFIVNILWIIFSGIELAITNLALGAILCVTIVGIPFGMQFFKIAKLSLMPFGAQVTREHYL